MTIMRSVGAMKRIFDKYGDKYGCLCLVGDKTKMLTTVINRDNTVTNPVLLFGDIVVP